MRKIVLFGFLLCLFTQSTSAQRRENIWMISPWSFVGSYSGLDFSTGVADTFSLARPTGFFITNSGICDTNGNLIFYTNGVAISNAHHDTLLNSNDFNPGYASTENSLQLNVSQGTLIVPKPGSDSLYYIFHVSGEEFTAHSTLQQQPLDMKYTMVDMSMDNGLGGVPLDKKSISILNDTLANGLITACKHGNGRDWWIKIPRFYSNLYYTFLLTGDTLLGPFIQNIGDSIRYDIDGQGCFSPDGSSYAEVTLDNSLNIFRFDRCTSLFYDATHIQVPNPTPGYPDNEAFGLAFSANSRFLYVNLYTRIVQYDTWAGDINSSLTYVARWDTFADPFYTYFYNAQLAPDNKIYIGTYGGDNILHYINQPDSAGLNCQVIQNSFFLPYPNVSVPTYPNYDLGALTGSPCDSLIASVNSTSPKNNSFNIFPNPASDYFWIKYDIPVKENAQLILYNMLGEQMEINNLYGSFKSLLVHTSQLSPGIYLYKVLMKNEMLSGGKIVISR